MADPCPAYKTETVTNGNNEQSTDRHECRCDAGHALPHLCAFCTKRWY